MATSSGVNPRTWAAALLQRLGIHQSPGAVQAVVGWARAEGGHWNNAAAHNPLNTTLDAAGARSINSVGVKAYPSWQEGLDATARTLLNGKYGGVIGALRRGDPAAVADAIGRSPWGTSGRLARETILGTPRVAGVHPFAGAGVGQNAPGGAARSMPVPEIVPGSAELTQALLAQQQPRSVGVLTAPAFAARPVMPQGAAVLGSVAPPLRTDALAAALATARTATPAVATSIGGGPVQGAGGSTVVRGAKALKTTYGGVTETIHGVGQVPQLAHASDAVKLKGLAEFDGKPVAAWIAPALEYARRHGWAGTVGEGFRTDRQQAAIYNSGVRPAAVPKSRGGSGSNHSGDAFPAGAVDVTAAAQLSSILRRSPYGPLLVWAGGKDPVHFSHPHNGGY